MTHKAKPRSEAMKETTVVVGKGSRILKIFSMPSSVELVSSTPVPPSSEISSPLLPSGTCSRSRSAIASPPPQTVFSGLSQLLTFPTLNQAGFSASTMLAVNQVPLVIVPRAPGSFPAEEVIFMDYEVPR